MNEDNLLFIALCLGKWTCLKIWRRKTNEVDLDCCRRGDGHCGGGCMGLLQDVRGLRPEGGSMNKDDKRRIKKMLDSAVEHYLEFKRDQRGNDRPCIAREVLARQATVFNLADYLYHNGFISYEERCEYLAKVDMTDEDENCSYDCRANISGKCKYAVNRNKAATALLMEG